MFDRIGRKLTFGLLAIAIAAGQFVLPMQYAKATNQGTRSGDRTQACSVNWYARSIMDVDGAPDVPEDLMVDHLGNPIVYANGGFSDEVSPLFGSPGKMEMQHWITGTSMNWRLFIGTDNPIHNANVSLNLPAGYTYTVYDASEWGATGFSPATGLPYTTAVPLTDFNYADGITIGEMPANGVAVIQLETTVDAANAHDTFVADGTLTGLYGMGQGCESTVPAAPAPIAINPCEFATYGRTVWELNSRDITARDKYDANGVLIASGQPFEGEINADGWGMSNPTLRLYGATNVALDNVTLVWTPTQGFAFQSGTMSPVITANGNGSAMGALYGNGFVNAATGYGAPTINADGSISLFVEHMPAQSAVVFSVGAALDGTYSTMSMNSAMLADRTSCPGQISGSVFWDNNHDAILSEGDTPYVEGKTVYLVNTQTNQIVDQVVADASGRYVFTDVAPGTYAVGTTLANGESTRMELVVEGIVITRGTVIDNVDFGVYRVGMGGGETPVTPVTPVPQPAIGTPISAGAASPLSTVASLPQTGPLQAGKPSSVMGALLAAIAVYGAVYFAQPRRSEQ